MKQHPCSVCGCELESDDMIDVVISQRSPRTDRRSSRSTANKYLPPNRETLVHLSLCNEHGDAFVQFARLYEEGGN